MQLYEVTSQRTQARRAGQKRRGHKVSLIAASEQHSTTSCCRYITVLTSLHHYDVIKTYSAAMSVDLFAASDTRRPYEQELIRR